MLLSNGSEIKSEVIQAFTNAVSNVENQYESGGINWDYVDADLFLDLGDVYATKYLNECIEVLVDKYFS